MSRRFSASIVVAVMGAATFLVASPAHAETCLPLPPTTGATLEVAGRDIRIPATSSVAVCAEPGGLPGTPRIDSGGGSTSLVLSGGSSTPGYVLLRYSIDGALTEHRIPIPGAGPGTETCIASVGETPRDDCLLFELQIDDVPTLPPTPTTGPLPTVPPVPTTGPLPTVPPVPTTGPLPTVPPTPEPDPFCPTARCIPYGGSVLQGPYDLVREFVQQVPDEIDRFLADPCGYLSPSMTCGAVFEVIQREVEDFLADPCNYLLPNVTCN